MSITPMNTCGESNWRTRRIVTPSAASSTSSTAALAAVRRALPAAPASARRSARRSLPRPFSPGGLPGPPRRPSPPDSQVSSGSSTLTERNVRKDHDVHVKERIDSHHPVPCERSQDSPAARVRWRADAADDAGFGLDRMEAHLDKSSIAQRLLPELRRCRVLWPDSEAVAGQVLRDAPPSADSLGGERSHFLAQDGTVAPAPAAAEHHVSDDQTPAGTQPLRRTRGQR